MSGECVHLWHDRLKLPEPHAHCRACRRYLRPYDEARRGQPPSKASCPFPSCPDYLRDQA